MKRIELEIKALSPLAIARQKPGGSVSEVENYIPGSVIRGAIAAQILKESGHQSTNLAENDDDFQALFLGDEPAIFQNAYPATLEIKGKLVPIERMGEIMVLPATTLSSKTDSGFTTQQGHGVFDTLIDRLCAESYGYPYDPNCPVDGGRVDTVDFSFYSKFNDKYYKHSVNKRLLTRVGINRRRATAEEQILYSIEVLNESQQQKEKPVIYKSSILVADNLADSLRDFIDVRRQDFRLGGSTSRGLGKVEIDAKIPVDAKSNIEDKVTKFNKEIRKRWDEWGDVFGKIELLNQTYFTLDLQSDAIFTEQWRRTTVISESMLKYFACVEDSFLKLEAAYSSYDYRSGWNSAWGLMKDVELVTNKGGVYLFSTTQPDKWFEALGNLEVRGVGDRTCEGFGQVQICNEFHLVFREEPA
ncbi:CRISPR-associated RAMP protein Csx10 [Argonema galeatum]|uniref:type III-D CRISPR-associated RAMP protein Csx10 n=1 Tax=Argonema galeatum TaxID=2942762 RepID=UPI0020134148|nr:CRISPR-associated RAMP protein Csx10 [Argonema galeatum]MCL1466528.1 CRISPR-associated RAMP protein Csx10 [Argonema galeatum A003/A1]